MWDNLPGIVTMIKTILVYIVSIPLVGLIGNLFALSWLILGKRILKIKPLNLFLSFCQSVASNVFLLFIIISICHLLQAQPVWAMWILPSFITIMGDLKRIDRVKSGRRMAEVSLQETGEIHHGSQEFQTFLMRSEYAYYSGDILGLLIGSIIFFRAAPLI